MLCAEFESDSLIGDKNSVTGVAFGFGKSGKLAGIKATPVAILIVDVDTFGMVVIFSLIMSTGADINRLSLSMLFDVVASGVGMRAPSFNLQNEEISNGQLILKIKTMDFDRRYCAMGHDGFSSEIFHSFPHFHGIKQVSSKKNKQKTAM